MEFETNDTVTPGVQDTTPAPQATPAEQVKTPNVQGTTPDAQTKDTSFDAFFETLSKRADDFFTNSASKQLEKKYGLSEDEIKTLITEHKNKQGNDLQTLAKENENLKNEIKNIRKNEVINSVVNGFDIKPERKDFVLKLADMTDIYNDQGEADADKVKTSIENVLKELPEFIKTKEPENFGSYSGEDNGAEPNKSLFNFGFTPLRK